jgi:hypothetical protein
MAGDGAPIHFNSRTLLPYLRRGKSLEELLHGQHLFFEKLSFSWKGSNGSVNLAWR